MNDTTPPSSTPFSEFTACAETPSRHLAAVTAAWYLPEPVAVPALVAEARLPEDIARKSQQLAYQIGRTLRQGEYSPGHAGIVQGLLQEFSLSSQEGVALMCLAEALLRIPDIPTRDALIRDKIRGGNWETHLGKSPSLFVNAATWGLLLMGKLVSIHSETGLAAALGRLIGKGGEPLIRKGVDMAMRMMGEQFVKGETIDDALANSRKLEAMGFRHSYDMLGEAALTALDARRYLHHYEEAMHAIGKASAGRGIYEGPGVSIKLSALHPRYSYAQYERVIAELYPTLLELTSLARHYEIGINIDAEEAERLELSLVLLEKLCFEPRLTGWNGIGFVIQAYQKRCPFVIDYLIDLARRSRRRLMIRLVKGAYWDSEIKRAQIDGVDGYPVFTRKVYTDVSYLACARKLLAAPDSVYPQFATHNAQTLAAIYHLAGPQSYEPGQYEFQCLHGMGEPLYEQVVGPAAEGKLDRRCRVYAPVGTHETLLAYLVRRLLENGANTSFVNRIADSSISLDELVKDPVQTVEEMAAREGQLGLPHPAIPAPREIYGRTRANSRGLNLANNAQLARLAEGLRGSASGTWSASPLLAFPGTTGEPQPVLNPADHRDVVGFVQEANTADVDSALHYAVEAAPAWAATPPAERAKALDRAADSLETDMGRLAGLIIREAGRTCANALSEVREAVDFLRFYGAQARRDLVNQTHVPVGPVACISPWNFPLAIFTGQIAAALAAGNPVLAKPAEQTPLIAAEVVRVLWRCGVPRGALQLLPGQGESVGARLVNDERVQAVMFTGSTDVARILQKSIAGRLNKQSRPVPLVAETGGHNAMIADSSALLEQVVTDVIASAFDSAGQRCSALRVLCVQQDIADRAVEMLRGAMAELRVGNPCVLATDVGPVIDAEAKTVIQRHIDALRDRGHMVHQEESHRVDVASLPQGTFLPPTLIQVQSFADIQHEVFGPVLHLLRFRRQDLSTLLGQINGTGYGLTLGIHSRIDETITQVLAKVNVGNVYVNRNMIGAVVGVQPFGGEGLSGTGPKAGGPLYLYRLLAEHPDDVMARALAAVDGTNDEPGTTAPAHNLQVLQQWASDGNRQALAGSCARFAELACSGSSRTLRGPTGERNVYSLLPRGAVLCLAEDDDDRLVQLAAVLAVNSSAVWPMHAAAARAALPTEVQACIALTPDWMRPTVVFDAVIDHGSANALRQVCGKIATRPGPIITVQGLLPGETTVQLELLVVERSLSVNTAAAGGNATLMTIG